MFFVLSKTLGRLLDPLYFSLLLLAIALILRLVRRAPRLRRVLAIAAVVVLWVFSTGVVSNVLLYPLETYHERPAELEQTPGAIVMLTGLTEPMHKGPGYYELAEGADRFVEAVRLAKLHPTAPLILSGGSSAMVFDRYREAQALGRLARELGVEPERLLIDRESRNTRENAVETAKILDELGARVRGPVVLVTSAYHMRRAVACFEKAGVKVMPWPVDYIRAGCGFGLAWLPSATGLIRSNTAIREYMGLVAYWMSGYI